MIRSVIFHVVPLSGKGKVLKCKTKGTSDFYGKNTGPFRSGEGVEASDRFWEDAWFNKKIRNAKLLQVVIEFKGGAQETIQENEIPYIFKGAN